jgi:hypothetical protein
MTGALLSDLWHLTQKYNQLHPNKENAVFPAFNILVMNDRIALVDQLRHELVDGTINHIEKTVQQPVLSPAMREQLSIRTYHSQADDTPESSAIDDDADVQIVSENE